MLFIVVSLCTHSSIPAPLSHSLMKSTISYEDKIDELYVTFTQHIFAYTHHIGLHGWIDNLSFFSSIFSFFSLHASSLSRLSHPTAWGSDVQLNQITEIILVSRHIEMCWALTCIDSTFSPNNSITHIIWIIGWMSFTGEPTGYGKSASVLVNVISGE